MSHMSPNGISIGSAVFVCTLTRVPNTHTDTQTTNATRDICRNMPHLCTACRRCGLTVYSVLRFQLIAFKLRTYLVSRTLKETPRRWRIDSKSSLISSRFTVLG